MSQNMVTDNEEEQRFELSEKGELVVADYTLSGGVLVITHVEAPWALRGTGAAGRLMEGIVMFAGERELKIQPVCGYAVSWLRKHSGYDGLILPSAD